MSEIANSAGEISAVDRPLHIKEVPGIWMGESAL